MTIPTHSELRALAEAATPGVWEWMIHDHSMASLGVGEDAGYTTPLIMNVGPCEACASRHKEWEWGRCHTPSKDNAAFIAAANPAKVLSLLDQIAAYREALEEIADLASLTVVGGDEFDRGARAARLDAADIAKQALSPSPDRGEEP